MKIRGFGVVFLLFGCVGPSSDIDPFKKGFADGVSGGDLMSEESFEQKESAHPFNYSSYLQGFELGRIDLCKVANAYSWGLQGNRYTGQCAGSLSEPQFRYEAERGYQRYLMPEDLAK
ncbi:DUF2799 domain-containing protein [Vibrio sp. FNV 38]|nr:DUF2799 domain-containing protein [Vibrio sp. FNV 38]